MPPSLATASDPSGALTLIAIVTTVGYVVACCWWPLAACRWCRGRGKFRSPSGKAWRRCRHCKGSGARVRAGRKLWTYLTRTHERGRK